MNSGGKTDADVAMHFAQIKNPFPDITNPCGTTKIDATDCDPHLSELKTGSETFNIVAGKYMYLNGYEILITSANEGLLYLPLIQSRIPVEWSGLTVMASEDGIYGCVTEGEARMQGSVIGAIGRDLHRQVMALLTQGAGSFSGKFGEALENLKIKATELKTKSGITQTDWTTLNSYIVASKSGFTEWKGSISTTFGSEIPQEVQTVLTRLGEIEEELAQLSACATENIPQAGGGNNYLNLTSMLRLACVMQFNKLIAKQEEAKEVERALQKVFWPKFESKRFEAIPYETVTLYEMSSWDDEDDELGNLTINVVQIGESEFTEADMSECEALPPGPPGLTPAQIRELFYADVLAVDMSDCPADYGGRTTTYTSPARVPRNPAYYWGKLLEKQNKGEIPKLLSDDNIRAIGNRNYEGIKIDDDWIKVCPKHAPYKGQTFAHHHVDRVNVAVGIPKKFHQDYFKQLHWADDVLEKLGKYCEDKKLPNNKGRFLTKGLGTVSIAFMFLDVVKMFKGDPTAGWNIFATPSEKGKLYYIAEKDVFLMPVKITKTSTEASMEYKLYNSYTYDKHKKKYIGVDEIGTYCEHYNHVTKQSSVVPFSCTL